eukprot:Skav214900  [mRNA]  locus=scaffold1561:129564:143547:- [translate_table: standard]
MVNLNARDRAIAAHAAAARHGKISPFEVNSSRPSSAKPSRPSSAARSTGGSPSAKSTKLGKETPLARSPRHWGVNFSVPRSFVEIAAGQHIDWLELHLGPKELKFQEAGAKLEAEALAAAAREALLERNGLERRRRAEKACRENRNSSGEPWRHGRHGGHGEAPPGGGGPLHLPSRRGGDGGLFSTLSPLEATESALRYRQLVEARRLQRTSRPASAPLARGRRQKLEAKFEELISALALAPRPSAAAAEELQTRFEQHSGDELFIISDLDVSQNKLSLDQFQTLFTVLSYPNVCVQRFRMFGCPTLNDDVMQVLSDYLRQLAPDCAPLEMHLSDCAVTSKGFHALCAALEESNVEPATATGTYAQKTGTPPAPEEAPPPRQGARGTLGPGGCGAQKGGTKGARKGAEFHVELEPSASIVEVKVAATAGCDIDPELMKMVYKGRVLKDEDMLESLGIQNGETLHIAKGMAATGSVAPKAESLEIQLKAPGGEVSIAVDLKDLVEVLRKKAASQCGLKVEEIHLLHKGKILKDDASLDSCGIARGSIVRVARRQAEKAEQSEPVTLPPEPEAGYAMPMAWESDSPLDMAQLRMMAAAMGVPLDRVLGNLPPQQAMQMVQQEMAQLRRAPMGETAAEMQTRWAREAADMAGQVRAYLEREGETLEDDEELLGDISRTLADARARGAPVPNAAVFVDRAVARRRQARAFQQRLDREASGLDPEIEDAFSAAEQTVSAAARAPRRLGGSRGPRMRRRSISTCSSGVPDVKVLRQRKFSVALAVKMLRADMHDLVPEVFHSDTFDIRVIRRCCDAQAKWLDLLEQGDEIARAGLFSGVARDLQELSEHRRMDRFRNVLQEHMMNDAHRYAFHRSLRVHLLHERCPWGPGVWCSEVCQWLAEDENFLDMALEVNTPAAEVQTPILWVPALRSQDIELVETCVSQQGGALRQGIVFVLPTLRENKDIVLRAVSSSGSALEHADDKLRDDEEVVLRAVTGAGLALEFASERRARTRAQVKSGRAAQIAKDTGCLG